MFGHLNADLTFLKTVNAEVLRIRDILKCKAEGINYTMTQIKRSIFAKIYYQTVSDDLLRLSDVVSTGCQMVFTEWSFLNCIFYLHRISHGYKGVCELKTLRHETFSD